MRTPPRQQRSPVVWILVVLLLLSTAVVVAVILLIPPGALLALNVVGGTEVSGVVWTTAGQPALQWQSEGRIRPNEVLRFCTVPTGGSVEQCGEVSSDGILDTALLPGMYSATAQRCVSGRCGVVRDLALGVDDTAEFPEFLAPRIELRGDDPASVNLQWIDRSEGAPAIAFIVAVDQEVSCSGTSQTAAEWSGELAPRVEPYRLHLRVIDAAGNCTEPGTEFAFSVEPAASGLSAPIVRAWADANRTIRIPAGEWHGHDAVYVDWTVDHSQDTREHLGYVFGVRPADGSPPLPCTELDNANERQTETVLSAPVTMEGKVELMVASISEGGFCELGTTELWTDIAPPGAEHEVRAGSSSAKRSFGDWMCFNGCTLSWPDEASGTIAAVHVGGSSSRGPCPTGRGSRRVEGETLSITDSFADDSPRTRVSYRVEDTQGRCGPRGSLSVLVDPLEPDDVVSSLQGAAESAFSERARNVRRSEEHRLHGGDNEIPRDDDAYRGLSSTSADGALAAALIALDELPERITEEPERYGLDDAEAAEAAARVRTAADEWLGQVHSVELNAAMDAPLRMADLLTAVRNDTMHTMGDPNTCPLERWPLGGRFGSCPEGRRARSDSGRFNDALSRAERRLVY